MPTFNFPLVTDWAVSIITAPSPPAPGSAPTFAFRVDLFLNNNPRSFPLRVETIDELSAVIGVLQIPCGLLWFDQAGQTLIRSLH